MGLEAEGKVNLEHRVVLLVVGTDAPRPICLRELDRALHGRPHLAEEVELALQDVREEYRQAFLLYQEQELSYAEIAETMDLMDGFLPSRPG